MAPARSHPRSAGTPGRILRRIGWGLVLAPFVFFATCTLLLLLYRIVDPPTTGVQIQRRIEALFAGDPYTKHYEPVPLEAIADALEHAVIAAEDGRFYEHHGVDWEALREAMEDNRTRGRRRGGSTITQQLVKNLFLTTHSTYLRKALEFPLALLADAILPKDRLLELYLNVVEWGPGVYGAEAAARYHFNRSAASLTRYQAAALAACLPAPLRRRPATVDWYTRIILRRMSQMGW